MKSLRQTRWPELVDYILSVEGPFTFKFKRTWLGVLNDVRRVTVATPEDDLSMSLRRIDGESPVETSTRWRRMVENEVLRMVIARLSDMDQSEAWTFGKARKGLPKDTPISEEDRLKLKTENFLTAELYDHMNGAKEKEVLRCLRDSCNGKSIRSETNRIIVDAIEDAKAYIEKHIKPCQSV